MRCAFLIVVPLTAVLALSACATDEYGNPRPMTDTEKGILIGAATGAVLGNVATKHRSRGALIGAIGGGLAGGAVGAYMDNQKRDLEKVLAPERKSGAITIDKLPGDVLKIVMTEQTAFEVDSAHIKSGFNSTMDKLANVLVRYGKTELTIVGHTDNTGTTKHNQVLSESRARAVVRYLEEHRVAAVRLSAVGKGESEPRASNSTAEGRRLNRRVEIFVQPVVEQR